MAPLAVLANKEMVNAAFHYLDLLPKGRDEGERPMAWLRLRDAYDVPA